MARILVLHQSYGCDSGCCGHIIEIDGEQHDFYFTHPYGESAEDFIRDLVTEELGAEHVQDIDFASSIVLDE